MYYFVTKDSVQLLFDFKIIGDKFECDLSKNKDIPPNAFKNFIVTDGCFTFYYCFATEQISSSVIKGAVMLKREESENVKNTVARMISEIDAPR